MELDPVTDKDFSPSKWCPGLTPNEAISEHVSKVSTDSQQALKKLPHQSHQYAVSNSSGSQSRYEYFPGGSGEKLVIFIHGGFWQLMDVESSCFMAEMWTSHGFCFAALGYELCPNQTLLEIVLQIRLALNCVFSRHLQLKDVTIIGHSSGAHLALMSLVFDGFSEQHRISDANLAKIHRLVLVSGIYDVRPVCRTSNNRKLHLDETIAWQLSPLRCVVENDRKTLDSMKILVVVAENDSGAFREQSKRIHEELQSNIKNVTSTFVLVSGKHHFDVMHDVGDTEFYMTNKMVEFVTNLRASSD